MTERFPPSAGLEQQASTELVFLLKVDEIEEVAWLNNSLMCIRIL